jgi:hypothetical protein
VNKSPGTSKVRHLTGVIIEGRPTPGTVDEIMLSRKPARRAGSHDEAFFSLPRRILVLGTEDMAGKCGVRRGLRRDGRAGEGTWGEKEIDSCVKKAAGNERAFIPSRASGSQIGQLRRHPGTRRAVSAVTGGGQLNWIR